MHVLLQPIRHETCITEYQRERRIFEERIAAARRTRRAERIARLRRTPTLALVAVRRAWRETFRRSRTPGPEVACCGR